MVDDDNETAKQRGRATTTNDRNPNPLNNETNIFNFSLSPAHLDEIAAQFGIKDALIGDLKSFKR